MSRSTLRALVRLGGFAVIFCLHFWSPKVLYWLFDLWPGLRYDWLPTHFLMGLSLAQVSLITAWFVFARFTLLERVCATLLMSIALLLAHTPHWSTNDTALILPMAAALFALGVTGRNPWLYAVKFVLIVAVGVWLTANIPVVLMSFYNRDVVVALGVAYSVVLLCLPLWFLRRWRGWRVISTDQEHLTVMKRSRSFSLGQLIGWVTLVAFIASLAARAWDQTTLQTNIPPRQIQEWIEQLIAVTGILIWLSAAGAVLLRVVLADPPWSPMVRVVMVAAIVLSGVITSSTTLGALAELPLTACIYVVCTTATLVAVRSLDYRMPRLVTAKPAPE
jgi:hypothetical protein